MEDDELWKLVLEYQATCEPELANEILATVYPLLLLYLMKNYGSVGTGRVEEIANTTLLKLYDHLPSLQRMGSVIGWCITTAKHGALDELRKLQRAKKVIDYLPPEELAIMLSGEVVEAESNENLEILTELLKGLCPECRECLQLRYIMGLTFKEVANELEETPGAVTMRMRRCLEDAQGLLPRLIK